jgi:hypothetical protein
MFPLSLHKFSSSIRDTSKFIPSARFLLRLVPFLYILPFPNFSILSLSVLILFPFLSNGMAVDINVLNSD